MVKPQPTSHDNMLNTYWQMILGQKKVRNMELGGWKTNSKIAHRFVERTMSKK